MNLRFGDILLSYITWLGDRPSARKYQQIYMQYFAASVMRDKPAQTVTRHEIMFFKQSYESTPAQCSKAIGLIKQAYNWASERIDPQTMRPIYEGANPAWRVSKHDSRPRERVMDQLEIRCLLDSIQHLSPKYQAFFVTRLLAPGRITELCTMSRQSVNLDTGKWCKKMTKNGRPQYVLIPRQAVAFLRALPVEGDYFFVGVYGRPLQVGSARRVWQRVRAHLGMQDVQLLDFRRTLATYLYTEIKADDLTAKAVLNHYDGRPVAVYTRLNYDRLAAIIQAYADWVWNLKPKEDMHTLSMFENGA